MCTGPIFDPKKNIDLFQERALLGEDFERSFHLKVRALNCPSVVCTEQCRYLGDVTHAARCGGGRRYPTTPQCTHSALRPPLTLGSAPHGKIIKASKDSKESSQEKSSWKLTSISFKKTVSVFFSCDYLHIVFLLFLFGKVWDMYCRLKLFAIWNIDFDIVI